MRRLLKLLAKLYPRSWRERYGAEFDALLDDIEPSAGNALNILLEALNMQLTDRNFRRIAGFSCLAGFVAALVFAVTMPVRFASETTFFAKSMDGSSLDVVAPLQDKLFREFQEKVIQEHNLYPRERSHGSMKAAVDTMSKAIYVMSIGKDNGYGSKFMLRFEGPDPRIAQVVNRELVSYMVDANLKAATSGQPHSTIQVAELSSFPSRPVRLRWVWASVGGLLVAMTMAVGLAAAEAWRRSEVWGRAESGG